MALSPVLLPEGLGPGPAPIALDPPGKHLGAALGLKAVLLGLGDSLLRCQHLRKGGKAGVAAGRHLSVPP